MSDEQTQRKVIGFAGRKRSGKGLLTEAIHRYHEERGDRPVVTVTIAGALKELCADLMGMTVEESLSIKDNGTVLNIIMDQNWVDRIHQATGISKENIKKEVDSKKTLLDVREVLQFIGTDVIRKYYPNWHIDEAVKRIESSPDDSVILVDDVRFPNELEALEKLNADVFFIVRPSCLDVTNHSSDTSLTWTDFDINYVLSNKADANTFVRGFLSWYTEGKKTSDAFAALQKQCFDLDYGDAYFGTNKVSANSVFRKNNPEIETIKHVINQNKDIIGGYCDGTLVFTPVTEVDREYKLDVMGKQTKISNPLIIENLKMFM